MRLSISNIAWNVSSDQKVAEILNSEGIDAIDIAPSKYFSADMNPSNPEVDRVLDWWRNRGIELVGMQSLFFGTVGLNLFGSKETQNLMLVHLTKVAWIAKRLGITRLVFGSPKNRDASALDKISAERVARDFFYRLGEIGLQHDLIFTLEPNPAIYSCNFITNSIEAFEFTNSLNHPAIKMQLDTGTIVTNKEDFERDVILYKNQIGHIHLSTKALKPICYDRDRLSILALPIKQHFKDEIITIEMTSQSLDEVTESIKFAKEILN